MSMRGDSIPATPSLVTAALLASAYLALHFGAIFGIDLAQTPLWLIGGIVIVQAWLSTGLFIVAHDCMHGSLAPGRPALNRTVGRVMLMIYAGIDFDRMLPAHFSHHRHTGTADDPDFDHRSPMRPFPWLIRFFLAYYTHAQLLRITVVAVVYMLLGANLLNIAVFWAVPALLALCQLFFFGTYLPHRHLHAGQTFPDRHNARSNMMPRWLSALTCFHFGGYHHEHHLHPHMPWWALPRTRATPATLAEHGRNT